MQLVPTKPKTISDRTIALDMLAGAKAASNFLCTAALAANNPDLKRLYKDFLQESIAGADALDTYIADQEWMNPFDSPEEQLRAALRDADELISSTKA